METQVVISIFISLAALATTWVQKAQSVSRETIKNLQDEVSVLKSEVKELKRSLAESKEQERVLTAENLELRHREEALKSRVAALEGMR